MQYPAEATHAAEAAPTTLLPSSSGLSAAALARAANETARASRQMPGNWWWGTGRRKTAVARVRIKPGEGKFIINKDRPLEKFFTELRDRNNILNVLRKTNTEGRVDVHVTVHGGGFTGQAGAIILGLGRALRRYDQSLEPILRDNGFLTRDSREVERKKYGQAGARRRFQFSKR